MSEEPNFHVKMSDDRTRVLLSLAGPLDLDADRVDKTIAALAFVRSQMLPEVPEEFPDGQPTHRHDNPHAVCVRPFPRRTAIATQTPRHTIERNR